MAGFSHADDNAAPVPGAKILVVWRGSMTISFRCCARARWRRWSGLAPRRRWSKSPARWRSRQPSRSPSTSRKRRPRPMMASSRLVASFAAKHITSRSSPMRARGRSPISPFQIDCRSAMGSPVENEQQAIVRADPKQGDKGGDAALAALALVRLARKLGARASASNNVPMRGSPSCRRCIRWESRARAARHFRRIRDPLDGPRNRGQAI